MNNVIEIKDIKGIELSTSEQISLAAQVSELELELNAACYAAHKSAIDNIILIAESVLNLRNLVESNLSNLGNYSSFKNWVGDRKFGVREIGYKQMSLYCTIGKNEAIARRLYNDEQVYSISELAKRINEETGNVKSGGRKISDATESDAAECETIESVTSIEAILAFIAQATPAQLEMIQDACNDRLAEWEA